MVKTELGPKAPDGVILGRFNSPSPFSESELMENKKPLSSLLREELRQLMSEADGLGISGANDFTDPALSEIGSSLRKLGKMIGIHVSESESYGALSKRRTGVGDLERVIHHLQPDFLVHMTQATQREAEMTAEAHLPVVLCPRSNCLFGLGVPPVRMLLEKGILVALGTDNFMANSPDLFREMEFTSKLIRGVEHNPSYPSAVEVLKMVTLNPAMILRKEKKVGSLERGKRADILFIDKTSPALHPLRSVVASIIHRAGPADLKAVMISGAWVKGNLPTGA
jgi:cytosine/adenosine deaminase-related metal-dependent hydrolase